MRARLRTHPWFTLAPKLPTGVKASDELILRAVFGKRLDVVSAARGGGGRKLQELQGPIGAVIREHLEAVRERPSGLKKASSAKQQRARKKAESLRKAQHTGSQGSLLEVNRVLYCVNGWNQLPLELLRKRWACGPAGSRALSERSRLLLHSLSLDASMKQSDSEEEGDSHAWARDA